MTTNSRTLVAALAALSLGLASCSGGGVTAPAKAAMPTHTAPDAMARLVPRKAQAVVYLRDARALLESVRGIAASIRPGIQNAIQLDAMFAQMGLSLRERDIDLTQPIAIASSMMGPVLIVGANDPADLADTLDASTEVSGSFVGIGIMGAEARRGAVSDLLTDLPDADVAWRVDVAQFADGIREARLQLVDAVRAAGTAGAESALAMYDPLFENLARGGWLDGVVDLEGDQARLRLIREFDLSGTAVTDVSTGQALLRRIPDADSTLTMLMPMDAGTFYRGIDWAAGQEAGSAVDRLLAAQAELYARLDGASAFSMALGDGGVSMSMAFRPTDAGAAVDAMLEFADETRDFYGIGDDFEAHTHEFPTGAFHTAEFELDLSAMTVGTDLAPSAPALEAVYGSISHAAAGQVEDDVVVRLGNRAEDLANYLESTANAQWKHTAIQSAIDRLADDEPLLILAFDAGRLMRQVAGLAGPLFPAVPDGATTPTWMALSRNGPNAIVDLNIDTASLATWSR